MLLFLVALGFAFALRTMLPSSVRVRPRLRLIGLPVLAAIMQVGLGIPPLHHLGSTGRFAVVAVSYGVVGIWLVANTVSQVPTLRLAASVITLGWLANAIAIVANRGMPVSRWALSYIGVRHPAVANGNLFKHVLAGHAVVLPWLGDVIPIAVPVLRNVISIGDCAIFLGVLLAMRHVDFSPAKSPSRNAIPAVSGVAMQVPPTP